MALVIKGFSGFDYKLKNGKTLKFKGGGHLNELSKGDFDLLCVEYPSFKNAIEKGFFIFNANISEAKKASNKAVDETLQNTKDKQESAQKANEARTGTKIKKG